MRQLAAMAGFFVSAGCANAATLRVIYAPAAGHGGGRPMLGMIRNGILYGADPAGGASGAGAIFQLTRRGDYAVLHSFNGAGDGSAPNARLVADRQGNIFGTTQAGGSANGGTVFELPAGGGALVTLHDFLGSPDGATPLDGLAIDGKGTLFGTTSAGDLSPGSGEVFSISAGGTMTVLHEFQSGKDGHCPFTGVVLGPVQAVYGTVVGDGFGGQPQGAIYGLAQPSDAVHPLYAFKNGADGEWPMITPSRDAHGNLFGVSTVWNASAYAGAVWTYTLGGAARGFHLLHSLNGTTDGYGPNGPLALGVDGNFYGTTSSGGSGYGTVFQVTPSGAYTVLHSFSGGADGTSPTGGLVIDGKGVIYGGTAAGNVFAITL